MIEYHGFRRYDVHLNLAEYGKSDCDACVSFILAQVAPSRIS